MVKQVIVVRRDLKMRPGKMAAQVAHAAIKVILDRGAFVGVSKRNFFIPQVTEEMKYWMAESFTKIVLSVQTEADINKLEEKAKYFNIPHAVMIDDGWAEYHAEKEVTCIALGPAESDTLDKLTKDLPLV